MINKHFFSPIFLFIVVFFLTFGCTNYIEILNPYENVDWKNYNQYKANLHTHSTRSDGYFSPQTVVDKYKDKGYSILAITDHNRVTYPWTGFDTLKPSQGAIKKMQSGKIENSELIYENRNPYKLDMIAVQGNEVSSPQHLGSYYTNFEQRSDSIEKVLTPTKEMNGILMFNHPGRYDKTASWYSQYFTKYDHLIGMEVYNHGDRYPTDRKLWDSVLVDLMPSRSVWGFSNDDFHGIGHGRNWNVMILQELTSDWVRKGMINGLFYFVYAPQGHEGSIPPQIDSITVNNQKSLIEVYCANSDSIHWIYRGEVIEKGSKIQLKKNFIGNYVRAEIFGKDSTIAGTQPFGVVVN